MTSVSRMHDHDNVSGVSRIYDKLITVSGSGFGGRLRLRRVLWGSILTFQTKTTHDAVGPRPLVLLNE